MERPYVNFENLSSNISLAKKKIRSPNGVSKNVIIGRGLKQTKKLSLTAWKQKFDILNKNISS